MITRALIVSTRIRLRARLAQVLQSLGYSVELADTQKRALELAKDHSLEAAIILSSSQLTDLAQKLRGRVVRTIVIDEHAHNIEERVLEQVPHALTLEHRLGNRAAPGAAFRRNGPCTLHPNDRVFRDDQGRQVRLTRAEVALLATLMDNSSHVWSRAELRHAAFGRGTEPYDRSIDMLVARLRRKIEQNPKAPRLIVTVPGLGYKFAAQEPREEDNGATGVLVPLNSTRDATTENSVKERYKEPKIATAPAQNPALVNRPAERRQLTVVCCSLGQSTRYASHLDPEDFDELVRRFHNVCATLSTEWGGLVVSSLGGDVTAIFGHPHGHEDDAERAVHSAVALLSKMGDLLPSPNVRLEMRIGVSTSLALVSGDQSVVGEAILLAPRLANTAPVNSVVVAEGTRKLLGNVFDSESLGSFELKGVPDPVRAYRIMGKRPVENLFFARRTKEFTTFVGRNRELEQLTASWERAKSGKGQVVLVSGEAGIGKSRLCEAFLQHIADQPHYVIRYQCSPYHSNTPFYPVINQLERAARFELDDMADTKVGKLEALLAKADASQLDVLLHFALLSIPTDRRQLLPELTPQRQRELTIAALIRQTTVFSSKRPVVIVLADAHWIDDSSLELLARGIASITTARILIVVNFRPDFFPRWLEQRHVTLLHLGRLSREETGAVILAAAAGNKLPDDLYEEIVTKADGIPLFAEELTQSVLESGATRNTTDQRFGAGNPAGVAIPATLFGSLAERLDRLGSDKEIVQIGAAISHEFSYPLIAAVAPISDLELQSALARLAAADLIFVRGKLPNATYVFKHALVQDAAYATMVRRRRQQLHSRIAFALVESFPSLAEGQPEVLAYHFTQAGLVAQAIEYLEQAARRAMDNSANVEAIGHLTRALELLASGSDTRQPSHLRLRLEVMSAQAMIARHGYAASSTWEVLLRAKQTLGSGTGDLSHRFAVLYGIWACHYVRGDVTEQRGAALDFLTEAEQHKDSAALCVALRAVGTTCFTVGEFAEALLRLQRARTLYDAKLHAKYRYQYGQDIGVAALCYLGWALWQLGYADQASKISVEAIKCAEAATHPHTMVYALCHARALMDIFGRRDDRMQSYVGDVVSLCNENGFSHWMSCARILEGWAEVNQGDMKQARARIRSAVVDWRRGGARLWLPLFLTLEAQAQAKAGDGDAALESIEEALTIVDETGERWALAEVLRVKAGLLREATQTGMDEIETVLVNSLEIARRQGARVWELRAACDLARLWQMQARERKGLELLQSVYDQFTEGFDTVDLQEAEALIRTLKGGPPAGRRHRREMVASPNATPNRPRLSG